MFNDPVVWYLFLGGSGAGAVAVLAALDLARSFSLRSPHGPAAWATSLSRPFLARGLATGTIILALGTLCLFVDLGHPERFYYVLTHPTFSVLTFGSYVLAATVLCGAALAAIALFNANRVPLGVVRGLEAAVVVLGAATTAYTGAFLASIGFIPLWNNPALPFLFALSSFSAGLACALGCAAYEGGHGRASLLRALERADAIVIVLETACLIAYLAWAAGGAQTVATLLSGQLGLFFWVGFIGAGLALPLVFGFASTRMDSAALAGAAATCVLIGGLVLRYCIVNAPAV